MTLVQTVSQGAPGGIVLLFYAAGTGHVWFSGYQLEHIIAVAAAIAFLYLLAIELLSDPAIAFIALPIIFYAKREIDAKTGSENFYFGHNEKKSELDDFDEKVFQYTTVLYAGAIIALSAPVQGYLYPNQKALLVSGGVSLVALVFSYLAFTKIRKIIDTSVKLYN
ncbi:hypothetical protein [Natronococcus wangiae]|uniref:hypothetical protein n=1 Tax=Natronococcus wangiae TaxID=3068275 RepID=UPI00273DB963|nr:hypothetical protein [Natronococcus sp. AD5]